LSSWYAPLSPSFLENFSKNSKSNRAIIVPPFQSCSADADPTAVDSCCVETYGGLVLATQFWDTYTGLESSGQVLPKNSWTLHGLWPDFCNGSYTQYCDVTRQFDPKPSPNTTTGPNGTLHSVPPYNGPPISTIVEKFGKLDLLAYMNKYWVNQGASNAAFWAHEFSKHGTCYSTFDTACYGPQYQENEDVVDFFETAIKYYRGLPTYDWLADAGIVPSNTTRYSLTDLQSALKNRFGALPYIGCSGPRYSSIVANSTDKGYTNVDEVWYYHHVLGRPQDGNAVPVDASVDGLSVSTCATTPGALRYLARTPTSEA
jgi:ribonuclease T2